MGKCLVTVCLTECDGDRQRPRLESEVFPLLYSPTVGRLLLLSFPLSILAVFAIKRRSVESSCVTGVSRRNFCH